MTVDISVAPGANWSTLKAQIAQYTGPSAYVAGGETVDATQVRLGTIQAVLGAVITNGSAIFVGVDVASTGKLQWFVPNTGAEATGAAAGGNPGVTVGGNASVTVGGGAGVTVGGAGAATSGSAAGTVTAPADPGRP